MGGDTAATAGGRQRRCDGGTYSSWCVTPASIEHSGSGLPDTTDATSVHVAAVKSTLGNGALRATLAMAKMFRSLTGLRERAAASNPSGTTMPS